MARIKQPAVRNPADVPPVRRSNRRRAVVRPTTHQGSPERVDLDIDSPPPTEQNPTTTEPNLHPVDKNPEIKEKKHEISEQNSEHIKLDPSSQTPNIETSQHKASITPIATSVADIIQAHAKAQVSKLKELQVSSFIFQNEGHLTSVSDVETERNHNTEGIPLSLSPEKEEPSPKGHSAESMTETGLEGIDKWAKLLGVDIDNIQPHPPSPKIIIPDLNDTYVHDESENEPIIHKYRRLRVLCKIAAERTNDCGEGTSKKRKRVDRNIGEDAAASRQHKKKGKMSTTADVRPELLPRPRIESMGLSGIEAYNMFQKMRNKVGLVDKGFHPQTIAEYSFIRTVVEVHGLEKMCEVPKSYNLTLLREFYAEVAVTQTPTIRIRETRFKLTAKRINKFLELTPPRPTEYQTMLNTATERVLDEVAAVLGVPNSHWDHHANFMLRKFRSCDLKADANVWINFLRHTISPTTHDSSVSVERMFLLYCLMQGKSINLGKVILQSLKANAANTRGKMYFPSMITDLLMQKGVPQYDDDQIVRAAGGTWQIDLRAVARLRDKKEKGDQDLLAMLQILMNAMQQQQAEVREKLDTLKTEVTAKVKEEGQKLRKELKESDLAKKHSLKGMLQHGSSIGQQTAYYIQTWELNLGQTITLFVAGYFVLLEDFASWRFSYLL